MIIGIPKEESGQPLVAATPSTVSKLARLGYRVHVQAGAGEGSYFYDAAYEAAGAQVVPGEDAWAADVVCTVDAPPVERLGCMAPGSALVCRMDPRGNLELLDALASRGVTGLAMDAMPRTSRAQAMDVRSSMLNIAGYRAVVEAACAYGRTFGGQVTAAGKTSPARVYVIGVGVAGLAAIGQAVAMGAEVCASDVRADTAEQVCSLGAAFVEVPVSQQSADGYARPLTDEEQAQVLRTYACQAAKSDVVITTAAVPGKAAPLLLTEEAVSRMAPGSVVVDMGAGPLGGNCALSVPGQRVVTEGGVTVLGAADLPASMPAQASQLYGQNVANLLRLATPAKDGMLVLDHEDDIIRSITVALDGRVTWPPPPVAVSAAPEQASPAQGAAGRSEPDASPAPERGFARRHWWRVLLAVLVCALALAAPEAMAAHLTVFTLACVVGFYVITAVEHRLHTPLMSETNAVSGIVVVGAILQASHAGGLLAWVLALAAVAIASVDIFGGFLATTRMLGMFEESQG